MEAIFPCQCWDIAFGCRDGWIVRRFDGVNRSKTRWSAIGSLRKRSVFPTRCGGEALRSLGCKDLGSRMLRHSFRRLRGNVCRASTCHCNEQISPFEETLGPRRAKFTCEGPLSLLNAELTARKKAQATVVLRSRRRGCAEPRDVEGVSPQTTTSLATTL